MDKKLRRQLTLFVEKKDAQEIEEIRKRFNQIQHHLIASHITLCREDELENISIALRNQQQSGLHKISIRFGDAIRFDNDNGVLIPASGTMKNLIN